MKKNPPSTYSVTHKVLRGTLAVAQVFAALSATIVGIAQPTLPEALSLLQHLFCSHPKAAQHRAALVVFMPFSQVIRAPTHFARILRCIVRCNTPALFDEKITAHSCRQKLQLSN